MIEMTERVGYIDRVAAFFGIGDLDFRLTNADRRRLIYASIAPGLVLVGDFILLLLQEFKDIPYVNPSAVANVNFNGLYNGFWWHIYSLLPRAENFLLPVAIALLILFAVSPVSRAQGSAALVATAILLNVAIAVGAYGLVVIGFHNLGDQSVERNWLLNQTGQIARDSGFLAAGYAFLAYRGLGVRRLPKPRRVRIPPSDQPREL